MTIDSVSHIASTPFAGLGTNTYNVMTTGIYTLGLKVTVPWASLDAPGYTANVQAKEVQTITAVADVAGSLNSTYWTFYTAGNVTGYYVWYNINSAGVDPAPAGFTGIAVAGATGATASTLGGATRTAIAAAVSSSQIVVSGAGAAAILTNVPYGSETAAADGTAATGFTFSVGTQGSYGQGSGLVIKAFKNSTLLMTLSSPTPSQPIMGGSVTVQCTAGDALTVVLSSLATADNTPNAVKGIINIFAGE